MSKKREPASSSSNSSKRLAGLGRDSFVSRRGITQLLKHCKEDGMPEYFSRGAQCDARKYSCNTMTQDGPLVETDEADLLNGKKTTIAFQNPQEFLYYHSKHSMHFSRIVKTALETYPSTPSDPWSIIIYQDGVDPIG